MRCFVFVVVFLLLLSGNGSIASESTSKSNLLLGCLPNSTEIVLLARKPFKICSTPPSSYEYTYLIRDLSTNILSYLGKGKVLEKLNGRTVSLAIEVCYNIKAHSGETFNGFDGGQVILFENKLNKSDVSLIADCCTKQVKFKHYKIGIFKNNSKGASPNHNLYICHPRPKLLVLGLDQLFVERYLDSLDSSTKANWIKNLRIDSDDALMAIRKYRPKSKDLASPFNKNGYFTGEYADPKANSLTMRLKNYRPQKVYFQYKGSKQGANLILLRLNTPMKMCKEINSGSNIFELEANLTSNKHRRCYFQINSMTLFGHTFIDDM